MKSLILSALLVLATAVSAQDAKKAVMNLNLPKAGLDKSSMVTVNGQQVPLLVLTSIQKICDEKSYSQQVCEDLITRGCAEYRTVIDTKNVATKVVNISIPVNLHVHEHVHTIDYAQEDYVYDYNVNFSTSKSTSHETKTLPSQHRVGTVTVTETVVAQKPAHCKGPACVPQQQIAQQVIAQPVSQQATEMVYPAQTVFAQELEGFINNNCGNCSFQNVNHGRMVLVRGGGILSRIRARLVRAFPNERSFRKANKRQRTAFFNSCLR